jgi:hypothetical protein
LVGKGGGGSGRHFSFDLGLGQVLGHIGGNSAHRGHTGGIGTVAEGEGEGAHLFK